MERLRRPPEVAHIRLPEAILTTRDCPTQVMLRVMAQEAQMLTTEEFASLLTVGNAPVNSSAPAIPAAHRARLIALGYMVDLAGRLRMTTPGRIRIYAGHLVDG